MHASTHPSSSLAWNQNVPAYGVLKRDRMMEGYGSPPGYSPCPSIQSTICLTVDPRQGKPNPTPLVSVADSRPVSLHLENIRTVFDPAMTDLARAFGVSRQSVYKWVRNEAEPEADKKKRIRLLSQAADAFRVAQVQCAPAMLKMKAFDGHTLLDLLMQDQLGKHHVDNLVAEARIMDEAYRRSGIEQSTTRQVTGWISVLSIPSVPEYLLDEG